MTPYLAATALAALPLVALWGLRWRRACLISQKRLRHAHAVADRTAERERFAVAIRDEALSQLRTIHAESHA